MANDLALKGIPIRINALSPGLFPSEMTAPKDIMDKSTTMPGAALRPAPMLRPGRYVHQNINLVYAETLANPREHEMAALAVYMASPASNFMIGHEVILDGGISLVNP